MVLREKIKCVRENKMWRGESRITRRNQKQTSQGGKKVKGRNEGCK